MTQAQDAVSFLIDPHPVRPGTSAALTARTIDATVHPPLIRAQEKAAELIPRLAEPLGSPLLLAMLAGTLVLLFLARRAKLRPAGLVLPAALLMTLTSFRPIGTEGDVVRVDTPTPVETETEQPRTRWVSPPIPEPGPFIFEAPEAPDAPEDPRPRRHRNARRAHEDERSFGAQLIAAFPEVAMVAKLNAEMIAAKLNAEISEREQRELREYVNELRRRLRSEARRIARDR